MRWLFSVTLWLAAVGMAGAQESPSISVERLKQQGVSGFEGAVSPEKERGDLPEGRDSEEFPQVEGVPIELEDGRRIEPGWGVPIGRAETMTFRFAPDAGDAPVVVEFSTPASGRGGLEMVRRLEWEPADVSLSGSADGWLRLHVPPRPGNYAFRLTETNEARHGGRVAGEPQVRTTQFTLLVMAPYDRSGGGVIDGYPIGIYPNERGREATPYVRQYAQLYVPPEGFIRSDITTDGLPLSRNYRVGDFVAPWERGQVAYVAVSPRLLEFLETALATLKPRLSPQAEGNPLTILNAFLTPNQLQRLRAAGVDLPRFSRYQYGDAAALIWDANGDRRMDDLNGDGQVDIEDARVLAGEFEEVQRMIGKFGGIGAGAEPKLPELPRTPYVDVDLRGVASRW